MDNVDNVTVFENNLKSYTDAFLNSESPEKCLRTILFWYYRCCKVLITAFFLSNIISSLCTARNATKYCSFSINHLKSHEISCFPKSESRCNFESLSLSHGHYGFFFFLSSESSLFLPFYHRCAFPEGERFMHQVVSTKAQAQFWSNY